MKKTLFIAMMVASVSFSACSQNKENNAAPTATTEQTTTASTPAAKSTNMTAAMFRERIMDYRTSKEWSYKGNKPVVIDFYATWCGPCKKLSPILDELASEYAGQVEFYKVDVDKEQELASVFGIQSIPLVLLIPQSGKPSAIQGLETKEYIKQSIDTSLLNK